jgi:hypothetical protein
MSLSPPFRVRLLEAGRRLPSGPAVAIASPQSQIRRLLRVFNPGSRRSIVLTVGLSVALVLLDAGVGWALDAGGTSVSIRWLAPARQSLAIQRTLNFMGTVTADTSTESDSRSPAEVFILAGPANLDLLAQSLLESYKDLSYGGIVLRRGAHGELLIGNDSTLSGGTIQVDRGNKGTVLLNVRSHPSREQLIQLLADLLQ